MRSADLRGANTRLRLSGGALLLVFALLVARAIDLTVVDGRGARRGAAQTGAVLRIPPARGAIYDRHDAELALTVPAPSIYALPREIRNPDAAAAALAPVLGRSRALLARRLKRHSPFVFLARWAKPALARRVQALDLPGVGVVQEPRRTYPLGEVGGAVVGFANIDGRGVRAIEQEEDAWLRGSDERVAVERDARGRLLAPAGVDPRASAGGDVRLTLDATLQAEVESALGDVVRETGARRGTVVVLDPRQGDLLAVAEHPSPDPEAFRTTPYPETRSTAFLDAAEPGSTMKPFVVAAALQRGVLGLHEKIDCENGSFHVPGKTLSDTHPHGLLDPAGILRVSSNIGAAKVAFRLGPRAHYQALRAFGFGSAATGTFPDESAGLLRPPDEWRPLDQANIAFGQGIDVTPIQLAAAIAVFANHGVWLRPRLVQARREPGGPWEAVPLAPGRRVLRPAVADEVRAMLETVVSGEGGTGSYAALEGMPVAGKTGTAQKFDPATGTYSTKRYQSWFVGIAPADHPRLVVVSMLDEPRGRGHTGGATAAPLFARAAAAGLAREGIVTRPVRELPSWARYEPHKEAERRLASAATPRPSPHAAEARHEEPARRAAPVRPRPATLPSVAAAPPRPAAPPPAPMGRLASRILVPDFSGLSPSEVRAITETLPVSVELLGAGRAVSQRPAPGTIGELGSLRLVVQFEGGGAH